MILDYEKSIEDDYDELDLCDYEARIMYMMKNSVNSFMPISRQFLTKL